MSVLLGEEQPEGHIFSREAWQGSHKFKPRQASFPILVLNDLGHVLEPL